MNALKFCGAVAVLALSGLVFGADGQDADLMKAVAVGKSAQIKPLIAKGANVNARHGSYKLTPLMLASFRGKKALVEVLLANGADPNATDSDGAGAMNYAVLGGGVDGSITGKNEAVIDVLKAKGAEMTRLSGDKAFFWAGGMPWPPKCFDDVGEVPPCGKAKEKEK